MPEKLPAPPPPPILPPVPPVQKKLEPAPPVRVFVHDIHVVGNTVFTDEQLGEVTKRYKGRELTAEDMEALRLELTLFYVNRGYVTSGAIIPDQAMTINVLKIQIVEGTLSQIDIEGNGHLWSSYVRNRIQPGVTRPVDVAPLQERLQFLQRDPHIAQLNAELKPGVALGESVLNVRVKETPIFHARFEFNNYQSPTVGAEQGLITVDDTNVTGLGDSLSVQYGRSKGVNPIINVRYAIPLNRYDTTFSAQYRRFTFKVEDDQFKALDIRNSAEIIGLSLRQPFYRTLHDEFAVTLTGEYERNESTLLDQPFEFVAGATNGIFKVAALRFAQEYTHQTQQQVFSAFSRFSFGIGALGTSHRSAVPQSATGQFFSWLGEGQYVRQLQPLRAQLVARTTLQLSNEHLFPLEQIAVGGRYSVRGYREYTFVRDNGFLASAELRVPVYTTANGLDRVLLAPFTDVGRSWNTSSPTDSPIATPLTSAAGERKTLASVGIGMIVNFTESSRFEVYWGQQLNHLRVGRGNLQDHGVHLQLVVQAF
ncbi:MAG: ShlB/FhaC/HecB family hemolysin secretion/activation protein [Nitrospirae bacterium]|nr:ShlB/FhaC/HecB family hemolysin secretion/activation protein [Nitrospirota bacterium]